MHADQRQAVWKPNVRAMTKAVARHGPSTKSSHERSRLGAFNVSHLTAMIGSESAFMFGSKLYKVISHAPKFGLRSMVRIQQHGNPGGQITNNRILVIITS